VPRGAACILGAGSGVKCIMYVENIYGRAEPYNLDCHGGAKGMYLSALEDITDLSGAQKN